MKTLLPVFKSWIADKKNFCIARVIGTWGSSPRPVGSVFLISEDQEMSGSVSGGCVEGAVVTESKKILNEGHSKILHYGISNEMAWEVGLSCGGKLDVFLQKIENGAEPESAVWESLADQLTNNKSCTLITLLTNGKNQNTLVLEDGNIIGQTIDSSILETAKLNFQQRKNTIHETADGQRYFIQVFPRRSHLIIIGAVHITAYLIQLARLYDFEITVIDPRKTFASKTHLPDPPDRIIAKYPADVLDQFTLDAFTYAVILSHDPKIDDNALQQLLPSSVGYIGVLGSKRNHARRKERLQEMGFSETQIDRIHGPVGVHIHARTPQEIALSIMAEIISVKNK